MCGIAGVAAPRRDVAAAARAMHAQLAHRGPDGEGIESSAAGVLCHRRLSVIDLSSAGAQPMWDASRRARITYNGEIYNYRELRDECIARGAAFQNTTDTEVVLNLFLLDGEKSFERLNGMFAFCLEDATTGESWLVRDPMGIKPLFWSETRDGVAFASELRALLASGLVPFEVDREALQAYLQLDFVPSPLSMVRGVRKLTGGHLVRISRDGVAVERRYSALDREALPPAQDAAGDVKRFDTLIHGAVERHLLADVPVGVFLSGGIDSSIVARVATDLAGRISTFSVAFEDASFDESRWSEEVAGLIGSEHHTERLTSRSMLELIPEMPDVVSEPLADGSIFPSMLLARMTRRHVKVALSGDGADELFAGYPTHRLIAAGRTVAILPRRMRQMLSATLHRTLPVSHANLSLDFRIKKFVDGVHVDPVIQNERWLGSFAQEELPGLLAGFDQAGQDRLIDALSEPSREARSDLERVLRSDRRFYLQDGVLVKVDRASMASSLEVRVPMLDHEIVRFANGLPADRKVRRGTSKWILRQWAGSHFPAALVARPKKGFGVPLGRWFRGELRPLVRDTLSRDAVARDGFFDPAAVERLLDEHERGRRDHRKRIFNLLAFTLWLRRFAR